MCGKDLVSAYYEIEPFEKLGKLSADVVQAEKTDDENLGVIVERMEAEGEEQGEDNFERLALYIFRRYAIVKNQLELFFILPEEFEDLIVEYQETFFTDENEIDAIISRINTGADLALEAARRLIYRAEEGNWW